MLVYRVENPLKCEGLWRDLSISFSKVPADAPSPNYCADSWFKKALKKAK